MPVPLVPPAVAEAMRRQTRLRQNAGDVIDARGKFKGLNPLNTTEGARPYYGGSNKAPSAKDSAQTSMGASKADIDAFLAGKPNYPMVSPKAKLKAQEQTMTSLKQSNEAWANKWSAWAHKSGMNVNKTLAAVREMAKQTMGVMPDNQVKYMLTLLKQRGLL